MNESQIKVYLNLVSWVGEAEYDLRYHNSEENTDDLVSSMRELDSYRKRVGEPSTRLLEEKSYLCWEQIVRGGDYYGSDHLVGRIVETGRIHQISLPFGISRIISSTSDGLTSTTLSPALAPIFTAGL